MTAQKHLPSRAANSVLGPAHRRDSAKSPELPPGGKTSDSTGLETSTFVFSMSELDDWFKQAAPGEAVIYHRGLLVADRATAFRSELKQVADRVRWLAQRGQVLLVQKRIDAENCDYVAVKAAKPRPLSTY
ncbi:conserved hypothetical protein [Rhodospirillaceae bacterium LM-1]|nr:conserved hypothetical protein [Rhodospirillaceae bacterium LM-1]